MGYEFNSRYGYAGQGEGYNQQTHYTGMQHFDPSSYSIEPFQARWPSVGSEEAHNSRQTYIPHQIRHIPQTEYNQATVPYYVFNSDYRYAGQGEGYNQQLHYTGMQHFEPSSYSINTSHAPWPSIGSEEAHSSRQTYTPHQIRHIPQAEYSQSTTPYYGTPCNDTYGTLYTSPYVLTGAAPNTEPTSGHIYLPTTETTHYYAQTILNRIPKQTPRFEEEHLSNYNHTAYLDSFAKPEESTDSCESNVEEPMPTPHFIKSTVKLENPENNLILRIRIQSYLDSIVPSSLKAAIDDSKMDESTTDSESDEWIPKQPVTKKTTHLKNTSNTLDLDCLQETESIIPEPIKRTTVWSAQLEKKLIKCVTTMRTKDGKSPDWQKIAEEIGMSVSKCRSKFRHLMTANPELKKLKKQKWSSIETKTLKELKEQGFKESEITEKVGKTLEEVKDKWKYEKAKDPTLEVVKLKKWSEDDCETLKAFVAQKLTRQAIADKMGLTRSQVTHKVTRLSETDSSLKQHSRNHPWSSHDEKALVLLVSEGEDFNQISLDLKRTSKQCSDKYDYLERTGKLELIQASLGIRTRKGNMKSTRIKKKVTKTIQT